MAFSPTTPKTFTSGETITAEMWENHVRDNYNYPHTRIGQTVNVKLPERYRERKLGRGWLALFGATAIVAGSQKKVTRRRLLFPWRRDDR